MAAKSTTVDQGLSNHYLQQSQASSVDPSGTKSDTIELLESKMASLRADMDEYQPKLIEATVNQAAKDIDANWESFEQEALQPLQDSVTGHEKAIEYVAIRIILLFLRAFDFISHRH